MSARGRSPAQARALQLAADHGYVVRAKGFGRDRGTANAVSAVTWKALVGEGLLTPHFDGRPFTGDVQRLVNGGAWMAFLTPAGREAIGQAASRPRMFSLDDGPPFTLASLLAANDFETWDMATIGALAVGESVALGGGATGDAILRRLE